MTNKIAFFYLHGTDPLFVQVAAIIGQVFQQVRNGLLTVPGLNGITTTWLDGAPRNDPFVNLLDPNVFEPRVKVNYPALGIPMSASINVGVNNVVNAINSLPKGQKFCLGGYSQGAAAMSSVYNLLRTPASSLAARNSDFLGAVMFGNPRRQVDYRGSVGGTWSGAWDQIGSTTGGHGSFPATGAFARLTSCEPTRWIEFTEENDIFSSTGDSPAGVNWVEGNAAFLDLLNINAVLAALDGAQDIATAMNVGGLTLNFTDALGRLFGIGGNGHAAYPWRPPPGDPDGGLTSFQIAVKFLNSKAAGYATAPLVLPQNPTSTSTAGWTTSLIPPA